MSNAALARSPIKRTLLLLKPPKPVPSEDSFYAFEREFAVLVINSSQDMAKEITLQLTLKIPGCSIMYAPTVQVASWILQRRTIHLVVSSPVLPDGPVSKLERALTTSKVRPDIVVVGGLDTENTDLLEQIGYACRERRAIGAPLSPAPLPAPEPAKMSAVWGPERSILLQRSIATLGADIRNDLNNPLQEIVAMVFVAQVESELAPGTQEALKAIDSAAKNMADYIRELEGKILRVVKDP